MQCKVGKNAAWSVRSGSERQGEERDGLTKKTAVNNKTAAIMTLNKKIHASPLCCSEGSLDKGQREDGMMKLTMLNDANG